MVRFNDEGFVIEVKTLNNPVENWLRTQSEMIDALQSENEELKTNRFHYLELLRNLAPDWETAQRLIPHKEKMVQN